MKGDSIRNTHSFIIPCKALVWFSIGLSIREVDKFGLITQHLRNPNIIKFLGGVFLSQSGQALHEDFYAGFPLLIFCRIGDLGKQLKNISMGDLQ